MSAAAEFERFRRLVESDEALEARLRALPDWASFSSTSRQIAAEHGFELSEIALQRARAKARLAWRDRWV